MQKIFGVKKKERRKIQSDRKWWQFLKKTRVNPTRALDIQHHVNFDENHNNNNNNPEYYEMEKFMDRDNNHYRYEKLPVSFISCLNKRGNHQP